MARDSLADVLFADGPNSELASDLALFGQFEGAWDLDVRWFKEGELTRREHGEWHFGWILEGRAMQDVWIVPTRAERTRGAEPYEYGTSIRFFDPMINAWRSTWIGPAQGSVRTFQARRRGEEIVLDGQHLEGRDIEWVFSDIRPDYFSWRFQKRISPTDDWEVIQAFECRRMDPGRRTILKLSSRG